ncbi:MAG: AarF/ABC1/UbiB kinase family protein [Deltaproteobacteria bacterium]|nr:AarF/ABC1/UbiB kinase family protein [Deltaproteobacteria bacterium]
MAPRGIVDEFENALLGELDFQHEAAMMKRFRAHCEGKNRPYVVPRVYDALSSRTVLSMEFIRGARLHQLGPKHDRKKIAQNIVSASFEQLFSDGLFHADPHPGNVFILDDNRLALLDFGCVGQISYAMRETLVVLVLSVGMRDADSVARLLYRVGIPDKRVSLQRLRDAVAGVFDQYLRDETKLANIEASQLLRDLFDLAARFQVRIPSEYALVGRAAVAVEGAIRMLDPELDVLNTAGDYIKRLVDEQFKMPQGENALKGLLQARGLLRDLPVMVSQILLDLESGKLQIQVENSKVESIARNIETAGITVFLGLVAGGLVTGSFFVLAQSKYDFELWGLPVLPIVGLYLASVLFGTAVGRYLLAPRLRKLSLARLMGRRSKWS